jgi:hypothetical protein
MIELPNLTWNPTAASSSRHKHPVSLVVVHRWGVRYADKAETADEYHGVIRFFSNPDNDASAHIVYPGSAVPNEATQMVAWDDAAWAEAAYNPAADDIESADAIWLGHDMPGMHQLARIVAFRLRERKLHPVWSTRSGVCRHADLGAAGGGHSQCPTTDTKVWRAFVSMVQHEYLFGHFREVWGR